MVGIMVLISFPMKMGITDEISEIPSTIRNLGLLIAGSDVALNNNVVWRLENWTGLVNLWKEKPIAGYGYRMVNEVNAKKGRGAHNDYVRLLVETGTIGLLVFILLQITIGVVLFRYVFMSGTREMFLITVLGFSLFVGWISASLGDNVINVTVFQTYFWAFIAAISGKMRAMEKPEVAGASKRITRTGN